jgi:hypothetical protein
MPTRIKITEGKIRLEIKLINRKKTKVITTEQSPKGTDAYCRFGVLLNEKLQIIIYPKI